MSVTYTRLKLTIVSKLYEKAQKAAVHKIIGHDHITTFGALWLYLKWSIHFCTFPINPSLI